MRRHKHITAAIGELILELYFEHEPRKKRDKYWRFSFQDYPVLLQAQDDIMTRSKKDNPANVQPTGKKIAPETSWVNVRFSPEQIQEVLHLSENPNDVGKSLASLLVQGYGFSVRANQDRNNFSAFITGIPAVEGNTLYAISGFAPTAMGAIASVLIKYYAVLDDPALLNAAQSSVGIG